MNYEQFTDLIKKITSYYPSFNLGDYQLKYWFNLMKDYDPDDINIRLDRHLNGELSDRYPSLTYLTKNLETLAKKQNKDTRYIQCPFCKRKYENPIDVDNYEKCYERCSSIDYITRMTNKFGIDAYKIFGGDYKRMKLSEINNKYIHFLQEVKKHSNRLTTMEVNSLNHTIASYPDHQEAMSL